MTIHKFYGNSFGIKNKLPVEKNLGQVLIIDQELTRMTYPTTLFILTHITNFGNLEYILLNNKQSDGLLFCATIIYITVRVVTSSVLSYARSREFTMN